MCPKCGGDEFQIVTLESVLQRTRENGDGRVHWVEPVTLAVLKVLELRCMTCGVDLSHNDAVMQLIAERCA